MTDKRGKKERTKSSFHKKSRRSFIFLCFSVFLKYECKNQNDQRKNENCAKDNGSKHLKSRFIQRAKIVFFKIVDFSWPLLFFIEHLIHRRSGFFH